MMCIKSLFLTVALLIAPALAIADESIIIALSKQATTCTLTAVDYTTFTETDSNGELTVTSSTELNYTDSGGLYTSMLIKDMGADYFDGDFSAQWEWERTAQEDFAKEMAFALTNSDGELFDITADYMYVSMYHDGTSLFSRIGSMESSVLTRPETDDLSLNTNYFYTLTRNNKTYTLTVRTGSHAGTEIDSITYTTSAILSAQYLTAFTTFQRSVDEAHSYESSGTIKNLEINNTCSID